MFGKVFFDGSDGALPGAFGFMEQESAPFASWERMGEALCALNNMLRDDDLWIDAALETPQELAVELANTLHALIRRRGAASTSGDAGLVARLRSDLAAQQSKCERLEAKLTEQERALASAETSARTADAEGRGELQRTARALQAMTARCADMQSRHGQFVHELRRKDLEFERLQARLGQLLQERGQRKASREAPRDVSYQELGPAGPLERDATYKMVISAYNEKQAELHAENERLRRALESLGKEHKELMASQGTPQYAAADAGSARALDRADHA